MIPAEDSVFERLADALGERYALERELGRGGMAIVFLARDRRQDVRVAIKVMQPNLAAALGPARFAREIEIARSMEHPLIVPVRETGEADGLLYYVMAYIDGESLFQRLERERRLPLDEALRITRDVADALGYAHRRGILHRDVKPENILLAGGRALVADFGLARAITAADSRRLTATGIIVGSAHYLSPEQLREDPDLDQRADIYSLGCVLYEMLTGGPPFTAGTLKEIAIRILRAPVPAVSALRSGVPPAVEDALRRALAKSAADRFATMEEFAAAL
ncbi:MAG TPA: serine/threonine-protein kinase [Gemmatimonadales bacterium]|nr:serine/threonine-protein kinase [Gemmatimonadales bacterium]